MAHKIVNSKDISIYHLAKSFRLKDISSKPIKYKEIMPRIAIEKLKLIAPEDIVSLIGKDLEAIRCSLLETAYMNEILTVPKGTIDPIDFEEALIENYAKTLDRLTKFSTGPIKNLLTAFLRKSEASNVKTMLRVMKAGINLEDAMKHIIPAGSLDKKRCRAILENAKNIHDIVNSLYDLDYDKVLTRVLQDQDTAEDLLALEVALDKFVYQEIMKSVERLRGVDRTIAKEVLSVEIQAINTKTILRFENLEGVNEKIIKKYLIPIQILNGARFEEATETINSRVLITDFLDLIKKTGNSNYESWLRRNLLDLNLPLSRLEMYLEGTALETSLYMTRKYTRYYNISFILAFLNLKSFEIKNLRCIIVGSARNIPPNQVKNYLFLPDFYNS
jgi:V/A-type H+/Na+-transporting ATPase subunit C